MADRIQQRRDTAARWSEYNPILLEGEMGIVTDNPNQYKIGDGVHAWNELTLRGFDGTLVHELGDSQTAAMSQKGVTSLLNEGYLYAGIAIPSTSPGISKGKVFYLASQSGTYSNFGESLVVNRGEVVIFVSNDSNTWVKYIVTDNIEVISRYIAGDFYFFRGYINGENGEYIENLNFPYYTTPFLPLSGDDLIIGAVYTGNTLSGAAGVAFYDADKHFISSIRGEIPGDYEYNKKILSDSFPPGAAYIRTTRGSINNQISVIEGVNYRLSNAITDLYRIAKENAEKIENISNEINDVKDSVSIRYNFEYGGIGVENGVLVENKIRMRSQPIFVERHNGNNKIDVSNVDSSLVLSVVVAFLGNEFVNGWDNVSTPFTIENGVLLRPNTDTIDKVISSYKKEDNSEISEGSVLVSYVKSIDGIGENVAYNSEKIKVLDKDLAYIKNVYNKFKGLKYAALGDSITYGFIPRNSEGYPGQLKSYAALTAEKLGMEFYNYGISGSTLAYHETRKPMCIRYSSMIDDADIITVMGGTNDIRNDIELGTFNDRNYSTFYGALHVLMQGLYTKYMINQGTTLGKSKKIIILTPIKLINSSKANLENTIENNKDVLLDLDDWVDAIKRVANFYSFPVLDFYNLSGINPHLDRTVVGTDEGYTGNYNPYITDGTHPTQEGAEIMSNTLINFLT